MDRNFLRLLSRKVLIGPHVRKRFRQRIRLPHCSPKRMSNHDLNLLIWGLLVESESACDALSLQLRGAHSQASTPMWPPSHILVRHSKVAFLIREIESPDGVAVAAIATCFRVPKRFQWRKPAGSQDAKSHRDSLRGTVAHPKSPLLGLVDRPPEVARAGHMGTGEGDSRSGIRLD
jgi:hypothetical protein